MSWGWLSSILRKINNVLYEAMAYCGATVYVCVTMLGLTDKLSNVVKTTDAFDIRYITCCDVICMWRRSVQVVRGNPLALCDVMRDRRAGVLGVFRLLCYRPNKDPPSLCIEEYCVIGGMVSPIGLIRH